jgi:type III restriction enzyme
MVVTIGAINKKDVNNLYKESEKVDDRRPIDLIKATRPILIVDEPQSVDGGLEGRGREALQAMHPLCTLRYSATHTDKHHMVYRLDAIDAYDRRLVKQIEVASARVEDAHNTPYVRLVEVTSNRGRVTAKLELDIGTKHGVSRQERVVEDGIDLELLTGRAIYTGYRVGDLRAGKGRELLELRTPAGEILLQPGQSHGGVAPDALQRRLIARTIEAHLDKELRLRPRGIKVLSLFFIDRVEHYRGYDPEGRPVRGKYARIFEEEYRRLIRRPEYSTLFRSVDIATSAEEVHDGYFSVDRRGR